MLRAGWVDSSRPGSNSGNAIRRGNGAVGPSGKTRTSWPDRSAPVPPPVGEVRRLGAAGVAGVRRLGTLGGGFRRLVVPGGHFIGFPLGRLAGDVNDPALAVIRRMLDRGRTWVKLSGAYFFGASPAYAGALPVARAYVAAAPEHVVWGSDWPHPTEADKPDDATLLDLLLDWAPDEATRRRILVDNPAALYGFP